MIGQSVKVTTIRGIDVGVHYSWFIILFLLTFSLTARFASEHPHWTLAEHYAVGVATSLLYFLSILLHELAHSFVALAKGIPVRAITLFVFGGVAQIGREPDRPLTEFQIAVAGPVASALLSFGFWIIASVAGDQFERVGALAGWLSSINLVLALFNLVPGFPLDGGRIFRAALWQMSGSLSTATRIAAGTGQAVGYAFIFFGIWTGFTGTWFSGLWMAFIGWFLLNAAQESVVQVSIRSVLSGLKAEDVMSRESPVVSGDRSLADLVEREILRTGRRCFLVSFDSRIEGLVTMHEVKGVPRDQWNRTTIREVMTPLAMMQVVAPDTPVLTILQVMEREDINQVPVMKSGDLLGMITRDRLLQVLSAHVEIGERDQVRGGRASVSEP
ncbi:MAG: site-2 protease family protein [Nitrospira sp.]|nr:site-2 protease family protein [Nitrospira sp.]